MRRLAYTLALAALGLVAGALTAHALHAQAPRDPADSLAVSVGCRLLPATTPALPATVHLDSAGIRVTEAWQSSGARSDGTMLACPRRDVELRLSRATFQLTLGDPPFGRLTRDSLDTAPLWRVGRPESVWPDSVAVDSLWRRAGAFATWRSALAVLAPRFHEAAPVPPVVVTPPTTQPPIAPVPLDPCAGGYAAWLDQPAVRGHDVERRDDARLIDTAGRCVAVVSVRRTSAGDRFVVAYPPCPGPSPQPWRLFGTTYVSRATAVDRAARGLACPVATPPATRAPDARNLPTPLPFTRTTRGPA